MLHVLVKSTHLREVASKRTGKVYFVQTAALEVGDDFPRPFDVLHDDPKKAYPVGKYVFSSDAIYVSRDGKLSVSPRLVPAVPAVPGKGG